MEAPPQNRKRKSLKPQPQSQPQLPPPAEPQLEFRSLQQVDAALREKAEMMIIEAEAMAKCNRGIDGCKAHCEKKVAGFADRHKKIDADIEEYVNSHSAEIFAGAKSCTLNFGTLVLQPAVPFIEELPAAKGKKESTWDILRGKLMKKAVAAVTALKLGVGKLPALLFRIKIEPDKKALMNSPLDAKRLAKLGFARNPGEEKLTVTVDVKKIKSHATSLEENAADGAAPEAKAA